METTIFWLDALGIAECNETNLTASAILNKNFFLTTDNQIEPLLSRYRWCRAPNHFLPICKYMALL